MNPNPDRYEIIGPGRDSIVSGVVVHDRLWGRDLTLHTTSIPVGRELVGNTRAELARVATIDHPLLTRLFDFGEEDQKVFYTQELVAGTEITSLSHANEELVLRILSESLEALSGLHEAGLSHGFVVPQHLRVRVDGSRIGSMRLTNVGLRRILKSSPVGFWVCDAPEMKPGAAPYPANDLFQLGAVLLRWLGGDQGTAALEQGHPKPFRRFVSGLDRRLLDLLDGLVARDVHRRPANALAVLHAIRGGEWKLANEMPTLETLIASDFVGQERALAQLHSLLREETTVNAVEVLGAHGIGKTRIIEEVMDKAAETGWAILSVEAGTVMRRIADQVRLLLGISRKRTNPTHGSILGTEGSITSLVAGQIHEMVNQSRRPLLIVADDAEGLSTDLRNLLRTMTSERSRSLRVIAASAEGINLPGARQVELERLDGRAIKQLLAPLSNQAINSPAAIEELRRLSGGSPLWIRLIVASWIRSGQLRPVLGRVYFDDKAMTAIPKDIDESVQSIISTLSREEVAAIQGLAVWGRAMPERMAAKLFLVEKFPEELIERYDGVINLIAGSLREAVLLSLTPDNLQQWHKRILEAADPATIGARAWAVHLLGAGRKGEAIAILLGDADEAERAGDVRGAWTDLKTILEHSVVNENTGTESRVDLVIRTARLAIRIGEFEWADSMLSACELETSFDSDAKRLDMTLLRANILREQHHFREASEKYADARVLAGSSVELRGRLVEIAFEEAGNDLYWGHHHTGIKRLREVMPELRSTGDERIHAQVANRLATLEGKQGNIPAAIALAQQAARAALRLHDWLLLARASSNLGSWYQSLRRSTLALRALERAERSLERCPHDELRASILEHRAKILLERGEYNGAEASLLEALVLRRRLYQAVLPVTLTELGRFYRHQGRFVPAKKHYQEAVMLAEEFDNEVVDIARANLGELLMHEDEFVAAEPMLRTSLGRAGNGLRGFIHLLLGRLLGRQRKFAEALGNIEHGDELLRRFVPAQRFIAQLEAAEVFLAAGDVQAAQFHLAQVADDIPEEGEHRANYELLRGRIVLGHGQDGVEHLNRAIAAAEGHGDPSLVAHVLIASMTDLLRANTEDRGWTTANLERLAIIAAQTDSRTIAARYRVVRGLVAERMLEERNNNGLEEMVQNRLRSSQADAFEVSLGDILHKLEGATGAMVLVVGLDSAGKAIVSTVETKKDEVPERIRPFRIVSKEFERKTFREALKAADGDAIAAARLLRLPISTFRYQAERLGILKPGRRGSRSK